MCNMKIVKNLFNNFLTVHFVLFFQHQYHGKKDTETRIYNQSIKEECNLQKKEKWLEICRSSFSINLVLVLPSI
jgi:hypothetical protein